MKTTPRFLSAVVSVLLICQTSAHSPASVTVVPNRSQYFEYEHISVTCDPLSSAQWTVWRYTTKSLELSQCGTGWGSQASSTCDMKTVKLSTSGVYWCQSKDGRSSNAVNITVTDKPVILQSPVLPVMEGHDVTLHCKTKTTPSNLPAAFYKDDVLIGSESTGHMIIHNFSKSNEGAYKCEVGGVGESPPSWLLMKDDSDPLSLTTSPDSPQMIEYEKLTLNCGANSSLHGWRIKRFTTFTGKLSACGDKWGTPTSFGCVIITAKQPDSAVYWCESPARQRSDSVNITVYDTPVILQSPVLPVVEGENITLHCKTKTTPSNLPAAFYKDGSLIRTEPAGHMTIHHVSRSDEGLYRCNIRGHGESPSSWLFVRDTSSTAPAPESALTALTMIRYVVLCSPYFVSTVIMVSKYRQRPTERAMPVSMTTPTPGEDDEGLDEQYDEVIADVTTEHHF
ncbi:high affinity immunoglobulin gamma Fc receptor I-like isoform X2 [Trachinotus anak]|uniref:high affinity immunoglobulin gamma Fc receptor I-like isoform X2 n=1 Tax=Trachinotus anak TaxID=443729 RepID=UPI0039F1B204